MHSGTKTTMMIKDQSQKQLITILNPTNLNLFTLITRIINRKGEKKWKRCSVLNAL